MGSVREKHFFVILRWVIHYIYPPQMKKILLLVMITVGLSSSMAAQCWDFIKEKNGIKIYTRKEAGNSLKSYKGVSDINAPAEKVFALIEDVNNTDWWDKNLTQIRS